MLSKSPLVPTALKRIAGLIAVWLCAGSLVTGCGSSGGGDGTNGNSCAGPGTCKSGWAR